MKVLVHQIDGAETGRVLPLAAGLLVATARADPRIAAACDLAIETRRVDPSWYLGRERWQGADVLAFSLYTWNLRYSLELARLAREALPSVKIVVGGPSVPREPGPLAAFMAQHPALDVAALGEGEETFRELLLAWLEARSLRDVPGLALRGPEGVERTAPRPRLRDFARTASPYLDGTFDALLEAQGGRPMTAVMETNRGCPFSCTFCDWGQATQSRVHELPLARVEGELEWIGRRGVGSIYLIDANFGIRKRDVDITRAIVRTREAHGAPGFVFFHLTKNAGLRNLRTLNTLQEGGVGCYAVLSMQDFDAEVLAAVERANIKPERSLALRAACNERGMPTSNELLFGLPEQTLGSVAAMLDKALTPFSRDRFLIFPVRVLPNTELAAPAYQARYGIQTQRCPVATVAPEAHAWVPEEEELVVATRSLPRAAWRRAFALTGLGAAAANQGLLDLGLRLLKFTAGGDAAGFLLDWLELVEGAPEGSVCAALRGTLRRFPQAVEDGRPLLQSIPGAGPTRWEIGDAALVTALPGLITLHEEVRPLLERHLRLAGAPEELAAAVLRYQRFVTPRWRDTRPREAAFRFDWPAWQLDARAQPRPRAMRLRWTPPDYVRADDDLPAFLRAHVGALQSRSATGQLELLEGDTWSPLRC